MKAVRDWGKQLGSGYLIGFVLLQREVMTGGLPTPEPLRGKVATVHDTVGKTLRSEQAHMRAGARNRFGT